MDLKDQAPEVEPKKDLKPPRKVRLRFADEIPHGESVARLSLGSVVLPRGEEVEVTPADAKAIKEAFGGRYVIEEVN